MIRTRSRSARWCALAAGAAALASAAPAGAFGFLSGAGHTPVEQRVAFAAGPDRSTLWASLRLEAVAGPVAMIVPAPPGSSLDWSSPAWLEALEVATAPRILPPAGVSATCPGDPPGDPCETPGDLGHVAPLFPVEVAVLADATAVEAWAAQSGLVVPAALAASLAAFPDQRFVAARFNAPAGPAMTPTLRVVSPTVSALPFVLTRAGASELLLTTWLVGPARGHVDGAPAATVDPADLTFDAAAGASDYLFQRRAALLSAGAGAELVESASHESLFQSVPLAGGTASVDGVLESYFERAASYGDGLADSATCIAAAAAALGSASPVAPSCARADLGVVDGTDTCVESVGAGETDPDELRCGSGADDLAVALSGLSPAGAWLTRVTQRLPAAAAGTLESVSFASGAAVSPVVTATSVDLAGCGGTTSSSSSTSNGSGSSTTSSSGTGAGTGASSGGQGARLHLVPVYSRGPSCSCSGTYETVDFAPVEGEGLGGWGGASGVGGAGGEAPPDAYYADEDCAGDTSDTYETAPDEGGGCGSDSSDTAADDGGCGSDSSDTASDGGGCDGDSTDGSGSGGDGSSGDASGGDGSSGETGSSSCAVPRARRAPRTRLSLLAFGALALCAPLRRALRRRRR